MGWSNSSAHYGEAAGVSTSKPAPVPVTIRETLDRRIENARKNVEDLCIRKAKLEALNVLDHPLELYSDLIF